MGGGRRKENRLEFLCAVPVHLLSPREWKAPPGYCCSLGRAQLCTETASGLGAHEGDGSPPHCPQLITEPSSRPRECCCREMGKGKAAESVWNSSNKQALCRFVLLKHVVFHIIILQPQQFLYILDLVEYCKIVVTFATEISADRWSLLPFLVLIAVLSFYREN